MATWEQKVHRVISRLSYRAWHQANYDKQGHRYKKHHPYRLPDEAQALASCLGMHDRKLAETRAKEIMEGLRQAQVAID